MVVCQQGTHLNYLPPVREWLKRIMLTVSGVSANLKMSCSPNTRLMISRPVVSRTSNRVWDLPEASNFTKPMMEKALGTPSEKWVFVLINKADRSMTFPIQLTTSLNIHPVNYDSRSKLYRQSCWPRNKRGFLENHILNSRGKIVLAGLDNLSPRTKENEAPALLQAPRCFCTLEPTNWSRLNSLKKFTLPRENTRNAWGHIVVTDSQSGTRKSCVESWKV